MSAEQVYAESRYLAKSILFDIEKGNLSWDDDIVQYFIPLPVSFIDWDWLNLIAKNTLIDEDYEIVKNFFDKVKAIAEHNEHELNNAVELKLKQLMGDG